MIQWVLCKENEISRIWYQKIGLKKLPGKPEGQTWKPRGLGEILGFHPKHDPPTAAYGEIQLLRPRRLFIPSVSFNRYNKIYSSTLIVRTNDAVQYLSTVWEWKAHPAAAAESLHTLLLVGHVLEKTQDLSYPMAIVVFIFKSCERKIASFVSSQ